MTDSETDAFLVREESIKRLERVVFALSKAVSQSGFEKEKGESALRAAIAGRCVRCGFSVTGEELLELRELPAKSESSRIKRLRLGQCANDSCNSTFYELIIQKHPDVNWQSIISSPETEEQKQIKEEAAEAERLKTEKRAVRWRAARLGLLVLTAILLWVWRQYYIGGTIPFLREPQKFRIQGAPDFTSPLKK